MTGLTRLSQHSHRGFSHGAARPWTTSMQGEGGCAHLEMTANDEVSTDDADVAALGDFDGTVLLHDRKCRRLQHTMA
jgi:hypothetical protein